MLKPVDGFSGIDVWLLRADDRNARSLVESATARGTRHVIVQEYLPSVDTGNKRLFVLDGEIVGTVDRVPVVRRLPHRSALGGDRAGRARPATCVATLAPAPARGSASSWPASTSSTVA